MIIMAGTGGGADQLARLIQGIIDQNDLSPRPFIPINKPGGSGAEALRYLQDKAGDDHTVLVTLNSYYTTPIINQGLGVDVTKFTPIGLMALDTFQLWVTSDSGIDSLDNWVQTVKAADNWNVGGTGKGQEDSILFAMLQAEFGIDNITYIPFPGGGTVAKNLIGKHIASTVNNPSEQMQFYRAGQSRPLVQFTDERLGAFPDVPTSKELGHDIVYFMQRSFNAPPGMSSEAQEWYISLFEKVFNSEQWQSYCKEEGLMCESWVAGADLAAFHDQQLARHQALIEKVGAEAITGE
ncbi:tripartite tricarboxylate transporter substrate binding protein [Pelagibius sp.]|uniref:Bug family tripartite tricarboxylate transporter substrate binding protein n=1 Tax=Pelagibius sp. TaxID=1931238 RepID=UPI0026269D65|nr:tripartite tricarboxylate transporter substrate binding protein [Pelagibius sp.]